MFYAKFALITKQMKGPRVESSLHKSKPGVITTEISCSVYDQILPIEVVKMYKDIAVGPGNAVQADTDWLGNLPRGVNNFNKSCFYQIEKFIF